MSRATGDRRAAALLLVIAVQTTAVAGAAEVYSNGTGGGLWSEPAAWRTKAVPGPDDTAVIAAGDTIVFDRDDGERTTCQGLALDPGGAVTFKPGGRRIMVLAGPVDAYGTIRLDATGSAEDLQEIRLVGDTDEKRVIRLQQEGALMAYGRPGLPNDSRNATLTCKPPTPGGKDSPGAIEANDGSSLDLQRVGIAELRVQATDIDNTGGEVNERLNISDCRFEGAARAVVIRCDTPAIVNNSFTIAGAGRLGEAAITAITSPLAHIQGNSVSGAFAHGVFGRNQTDSTVQGNTIDTCDRGIYWERGSNAMIKGNVIRNGRAGVHCVFTTGLLEDNTIDGCKTGIEVASATVQVTGLTIMNQPADGLPINLSQGQVTLVNTDLLPEQVKVGGPAPKEGAWVETLQYLVVGIKGRAPAGAEVDVVTKKPAAPLSAGAADLNVRNSPAPLTPRGSTPLPASLRALLVRGWSVGADGKVQAAPEYLVRLLAPPNPAAPDAPRKTLKEIAVTPAPGWRRATPADAAPTVEIQVP